ncbi:hypothetical protein O181_068157 [Austropuccinia psidii MF-1]|uniref:Uncharacterized protein n=1 Tax=Austropuccinia psidii MF-1 TaxID=1389203 RepID=A0A9Q3EYS5_9BASI|nr:hypothetical protein [Austropuccinia psidii MF-1]
MTEQTPPITPGKDSTLTGELVNQEAELNDNDAYVLGLNDSMMEIKSSNYGQDKPPSIIIKIQKKCPPLSHSSKYSDDVMVGTKPNIENHEDNDNQTNHKRKLT